MFQITWLYMPHILGINTKVYQFATKPLLSDAKARPVNESMIET